MPLQLSAHKDQSRHLRCDRFVRLPANYLHREFPNLSSQSACLSQGPCAERLWQGVHVPFLLMAFLGCTRNRHRPVRVHDQRGHVTGVAGKGQTCRHDQRSRCLHSRCRFRTQRSWCTPVRQLSFPRNQRSHFQAPAHPSDHGQWQYVPRE
ncbi:unannotated protein [freshwater metagenome]|uniref:Unannotated protein n=1 Tax=freshwater metagenome TaxID=449393 RepID=A0A6J6IXX7_9ZZZZ